MIEIDVEWQGVTYTVEGYFTKGSPATWGYDGGCPEEPASFEVITITPEPTVDPYMDDEFYQAIEERAAEEAMGQAEADEDYYWEDR